MAYFKLSVANPTKTQLHAYSGLRICAVSFVSYMIIVLQRESIRSSELLVYFHC